jgi:hypothetical protein
MTSQSKLQIECDASFEENSGRFVQLFESAEPDVLTPQQFRARHADIAKGLEEMQTAEFKAQLSHLDDLFGVLRGEQVDGSKPELKPAQLHLSENQTALLKKQKRVLGLPAIRDNHCGRIEVCFGSAE